MISHKNTTKVVGVVMVICVSLCILAMIFSQKVVEVFGSSTVAMQYESVLFDTDEPIQIAIQMEEDEWEDMLDKATAEEYYACDVVINGHEICNVGIRPKGNTSLSAIAMDSETDRFSLKLEFDHYVEGQTCFGLDKLILNNNYADATNMKEAVVYDMYQYLGVDASLYHYAKISVNGEYWGVYLALEAVEESFLLRNYGTEDGALYKPDSMDMGGSFKENEFGDKEFSGRDGERKTKEKGFPDVDEKEAEADVKEFRGENRPGQGNGEFEGGPPGPGGGFGMGGNGADLNYSDDDLDSY